MSENINPDTTVTADNSGLPLQGFKVVELGHSVAAPYAGLIFAEMGAEVIKVERPGSGDDARAWGPPFVDDMSAVFHALNRHKQSVTADLKSPEGVETVKRLARSADILIQNLKPGLAEQLGLGAEALRAENPRLIYASIHAFGSKGPFAGRPGYDPLMQAFGGVMSTQGEPGRRSVRVGTSIIDMGTGMWVVMGVLTALAQSGPRPSRGLPRPPRWPTEFRNGLGVPATGHASF
jgi:crotonobetainyl-CoA:carnitine CoA-transferase CaiB-like acyl-CoA transferase